MDGGRRIVNDAIVHDSPTVRRIAGGAMQSTIMEAAADPAADRAVTLSADLAVGVAEAWRIRDAIAALPPATAVVVDLRRATRIDDAAVAVIARASAAPGGRRLTLLGLSSHQRKLLRYLLGA